MKLHHTGSLTALEVEVNEHEVAPGNTQKGSPLQGQSRSIFLPRKLSQRSHILPTTTTLNLFVVDADMY
jgi:hypothetical protein